MRLLSVLLVLLATTAHARECEAPKQEGGEVRGLRAYVDCMNKAVATLERDNADLKKELEKIQASLSKFPGEFRNEDGRVTRSGGDSLVHATFSTGARRREAAAALGIDQKALEALCAVGCTINLMLSAEGLRKSDPPPVFADATCTLRYTAKSGAWSQGGGCGDAVSGVDGDGKPPGGSGGEIIGSAGEACILADSEPARGVSPDGQLLNADRAKGLYLIAAPALWTGTETRFRCELKLSR